MPWYTDTDTTEIDDSRFQILAPAPLTALVGELSPESVVRRAPRTAITDTTLSPPHSH